MGFEFDEDTAVRRIEPGFYRGEVTARWDIGGKANGGYLLALALQAAAAELPHPDPLTSTGHFLRPPMAGAVELTVETVRVGRGHSTAEVHMRQAGNEILRVLTTFADLGAVEGPTRYLAGPPPLTAPEECIPAQATLRDGTVVEVINRVDALMEPRTVGWVFGKPSHRAEIGGWLRLADGREPDPMVLAFAADAMAPTVFGLGARGWVPTVEMTVHVRQRPAPGWLRIWVTSRFVTFGYVEEDAEIWDSEGRLVAQARQLARLTGTLPQVAE